MPDAGNWKTRYRAGYGRHDEAGKREGDPAREGGPQAGQLIVEPAPLADRAAHIVTKARGSAVSAVRYRHPHRAQGAPWSEAGECPAFGPGKPSDMLLRPAIAPRLPVIAEFVQYPGAFSEGFQRLALLLPLDSLSIEEPLMIRPLVLLLALSL